MINFSNLLSKDCIKFLFLIFQAIGGIGPKIISTLIVWGAYPTWGSLIFKPEDIAALDNPSSAVSRKITDSLSLKCNILPQNLDPSRNFNCTLPSSNIANKTLALKVSNSSFTCNYLPFKS